MKRVLIFLSCVVLADSALATIVRPIPLQELYQNSAIVVRGRIESGRLLADDCGLEFGVRVTKGFKGAKSGTLLFFRGNTIQVGGDYFLFLDPRESDTSAPMRAAFETTCKGKLPPLEVNVFGVGAMKVTGTYNKRVSRAVVVDDFMIIQPKDLPVTQLKARQRYDNDHNDTVFDAAQFEAYVDKLSRGQK
jgi:hypothetical protein